ncbi:iron-containing redox enzyme family protein [Nocardioides sp. AX2bis]|uniref:iron-containing redox enzyme family protein n=1 Tax=Nocardioides sp. AX2bis TaxID=2653157 RepID=UPI0012EF78F2|nr:iron-containing redox enzyme family protein [Nocardioides sp. AX2bis]VXB61848.1 Iron-containing redox enzyme [Nocardioides sp. AX2bis]
MLLPPARGPMGTALHALLLTPAPAHADATLPAGLASALDPAAADPEDAAQCLWVLHELHYRGFAEVDDAWEWSPQLMPLRRALEQDLERRLRDRFEAGWEPVDPADDVTALVQRIIEADDAPSLARHLQRRGTREEALALLRQRSLYHLKEADPTSWVVPRLTARPKAALVEVQSDEYGAGDPERLHHRIFERGMTAAGLEAEYGHYVAEATLPILEQNNAVSMFGLHRRLRGAAVGHFAAFEATSSVPSRQLAQGLRRLEVGEDMAGYYDEHVEADAVHEHLALVGVCGALVDEEPGLLADVALGAWTCLDLEARTALDLLTRWGAA